MAAGSMPWRRTDVGKDLLDALLLLAQRAHHVHDAVCIRRARGPLGLCELLREACARLVSLLELAHHCPHVDAQLLSPRHTRHVHVCVCTKC